MNQIVDNSIKRIEYKIQKSIPLTNRQMVEQKVELENIKKLKDKNEK